jgi:hypothetical protein
MKVEGMGSDSWAPIISFLLHDLTTVLVLVVEMLLDELPIDVLLEIWVRLRPLDVLVAGEVSVRALNVTEFSPSQRLNRRARSYMRYPPSAQSGKPSLKSFATSAPYSALRLRLRTWAYRIFNGP